MNQNHRDRERGNGAEFQKRAEIIARREKHPDRQNRRGQSINHDRPCDPFFVMAKPALDRGKMGEKLSAPDTERESGQSKDRDRSHVHFSVRNAVPMMNATGIVIAIVNTPHGLFASACTTTSASTAIKIIMIARTLISASDADSAADFFLHHLAERFAAAPYGSEKHNHVVHAAAERCADQNPECSRQKTKLRGEHRADQWSRSRDRGKVMAENHPAICRDKIFAIGLHDGRRRALVIEDKNFGREPFAVETIADGESAQSCDHDPKRVNRFATRKAERQERKDQAK